MSPALRHPGASAGCPLCRGQGITIVRSGERAVAQRCSCIEACPLCGDAGFVTHGEDRLSPRARCRCQAVLGRLRWFDAVGIPARHADSTRASFEQRGRVHTQLMGRITQWLEDFAPGQDNRGLVLYGPVGTGKTHLMVALLRELVFRRAVRCRFVEFSHLLSDIKAGFDAGQGASRLLDPLVEVDVLAIDELGKGRNTEFENQVVDELVSRRYNAMRPILATTNYGPGAGTGRGVPSAAASQLGAAPEQTLGDRIGDRVYSRLRETADFLGVTGDDYRQLRGRR